jgi:hypothetical protein
VTDYEGLLKILGASGARWILIGGFAATVHGSVRLTVDLDIVYCREPEDVRRLVSALAPCHPYPRGAPPGLPFLWDAETVLRGLNFTLTTSLGDLDVLGEITGGGTYETLLPDTIEVRPFGIPCRCLRLGRLIQVKRAAGRPKDFEAIGELERILEEAGDDPQRPKA